MSRTKLADGTFVVICNECHRYEDVRGRTLDFVGTLADAKTAGWSIDPWGAPIDGVYFHDMCPHCAGRYEPPGPDYDAVSAGERHQQAWDEKRRLRG